MTDKTKRIIVWILIIATVGSLVLGVGYNIYQQKKMEEVQKSEEIVQKEKPTKTDLEIGKEIVDFTLKNLDGEEVSVSDYKGKIVLINFWGTWCTYCDQEMPDLQKIQEDNDDVVVLAVNVEEEYDAVKNYIEEGEYDFEVLLDLSGKVASEYLVAGFPSTYFVDKEGIFHGRVPQLLTYEQMDEVINDLRDQ